MRDVENYILDMAMLIVTVWIVKRFWGSFFVKKSTSILSVVIWIVFCFFQFVSYFYSGSMHVGMTIINILLIYAIAVSEYQSKSREKNFLIVIFCVVWSLLEILVFFLVNELDMKQEGKDVIGLVISKLLMVLLVYIVSIVWNGKSSGVIHGSFYLYLLFMPVGSIYIAVNQYYAQSRGIFSAIAISILLIFNIMIFDIYIKMSETFAYEKEKAVYVQQSDIVAVNIAEQKKVMEQFHEEKHNLVNELIVLKEAIEKEDREFVIKNINKIINNYHSVERVSDSGNSTIDAIINFKYSIAKEYGIDFHLKLFIPDELPIEQCDIGVVIGNAIDNAIEAVRDCGQRSKVIEISMGIKKEAWIMVIKNPFEHEIERDRTGRILSSKQDHHRHGYGLKSIERIAEKYQGEISIEIENDIFVLTVVLNFEEF